MWRDTCKYRLQVGGHAPDTEKAKVASRPGTHQKPTLDAPFGRFLVPVAPGALFDKTQAQILGPLCFHKSCTFRLKRGSGVL